MARILALDYGEKSTGIAVTDQEQRIAFGLAAVPTVSLLSFLKTYLAKEPVALVLIGEPKRLSGAFSDVEASIQVFIAAFQREAAPIPIERVDERFTSKMAFQALLEGGAKKKQRRNKGLIDEMSATLILQGYLQKRDGINKL